MEKPNPMMDHLDLYAEVRRLLKLRDAVRNREKLDLRIEEVAAMARYAYRCHLDRFRDD